MIIAIYMDNLLIAGASKSDIQALKDSLLVRFKMLDLSLYYFYLGIEVIRDYPY